MSEDPNCVFCRIVRGELPCRKAHEDSEILVFHDIHPVAPMHLLMIPKRHIASMAELSDEDAPLMGRLMVLARRLADAQGSSGGFRLIANTGQVGRQDVYHLHFHLLGGDKPLPGMIAKA